MKKHLLLSLAILGCIHNLTAQNLFTDSTATCIGFWGKKDVKRYTLTKTKDRRFADSVDHSSITSQVTIKVLDSTENGYRLEWKHENAKIEGMDDQSNSLTSLVMGGLRFIYSTDETGIFKELENWKEVRDFYVNMMKMRLEQKPVKQESKSMLDKLITTLGTREAVESIMIKEIQLFHSPFGAEFNKKGVVLETELPNVLGPNPIPAQLSLSLVKLDTPKALATILVAQEIDRIKGREVLLGIIQQMAGNISAQDLANQIKKIDISDKTSFTYYLSSGWFSNIHYERTVDVGGGKQAERIVFEEKRE